mmetsp:Transcript_5150/g.7966  ORF Transcript_5150/g.7966 Transcript_5150/m.7966 type:complete len:531 (-) Transcript_5150:636-2228(-)
MAAANGNRHGEDANLAGLSWFLALQEEGDLALRLLKLIGREKIVLSLHAIQEDVASRVKTSNKKILGQSLSAQKDSKTRLHVPGFTAIQETPRGIREERSYQDREMLQELQQLKTQQDSELEELVRRWDAFENGGNRPSHWFQQLRWIFKDARPLIGLPPDAPLPASQSSIVPPAPPVSEPRIQPVPLSTSAAWALTAPPAPYRTASRPRPAVPKLDLSAVVKPDPVPVVIPDKSATVAPLPPSAPAKPESGPKSVLESIKRREIILTKLSDHLLRELAREGDAWRAFKETHQCISHRTNHEREPFSVKPEVTRIQALATRIDSLAQVIEKLRIGPDSISTVAAKTNGKKEDTISEMEVARVYATTDRLCRQVQNLTEEIRTISSQPLGSKTAAGVASKPTNITCDSCDDLRRKVALCEASIAKQNDKLRQLETERDDMRSRLNQLVVKDSAALHYEEGELDRKLKALQGEIERQRMSAEGRSRSFVGGDSSDGPNFRVATLPPSNSRSVSSTGSLKRTTNTNGTVPNRR